MAARSNPPKRKTSPGTHLPPSLRLSADILDFPNEDQAKVDRAEAAGLNSARLAMWAARLTGVPYFVVCAFLEQESSGDSVYGHDGGPDHLFFDHGRVTSDNWQAYKRERDRTNQHQGAGVLQATSHWWQDKVDDFGGADSPLASLLVPCLVWAAQKRSGMTWQEIATDYNGSAEYGAEVAGKIEQWKVKLTR